ncbi:uncharacterized protein SETTUDRAFT_18920 [Exserohilum turcica Et28A]|uniref:Uncharacterized protein n=1 Tax=Exserohilum turcicum (strain 28A) TaxID=671987 RepID=R0KTM4_EXST2|nr:uncharacterized protein SETTUDRAFT_18920 [Exserohilum turcica Et28A]EOA92274.1 hypothetical protein SETTUDRAFT_18920 [Exserohilum turcica Et28A]
MEDGVTLDLKYLNTVSYNAESASVGFRARRNIKRSLHCPRDPGAMFPGECSSSVGVGGPRTGRRDILLFTQPQLLLNFSIVTSVTFSTVEYNSIYGSLVAYPAIYNRRTNSKHSLALQLISPEYRGSQTTSSRI